MFLARVPGVGPTLILAASLAFGGLAQNRAWAADQEYLVADDDGYGIADCMKPGMECGRVMADAWCEAHGHGHADTFGLAEDVTGSTKISTAPSAPLAANAVVIRCGE
jgi:hypothetical protein